MADEQAYAGIGGPEDAHNEYSRARFIAEQVLNRAATITLVLVKAYDADKKTVDVQPMVAQLDGAGSAFQHGVINALPVWAMQGGDSGIIVTPKVGDIGLATFCHSDISSVKETKAPAPPGSRRRFDWADGIYLGGVLNGEPTQFIRLTETGGIEITSPDSRPIVITAGGDVSVVAGGTATVEADEITMDGNVTVTGTLTADGALTVPSATIGGKDFATHRHTGVTTGGGVSGPVQ